MIINVVNENGTVTLTPMEKVDFVSAPELEQEIEQSAETADRMILDLCNVDYISSAGLRAILLADNLMSEKNGLVLKNVNSYVQEILNISGFSSELKIE
ncbi:MAG: STAS domain-containing protein [Eubacteriales bacterium]|nr:STAS domain-containing protein [Eubacteriales bacterium]